MDSQDAYLLRSSISELTCAVNSVTVDTGLQERMLRIEESLDRVVVEQHRTRALIVGTARRVVEVINETNAAREDGRLRTPERMAWVAEQFLGMVARAVVHAAAEGDKEPSDGR